jgi:hypothetical protein
VDARPNGAYHEVSYPSDSFYISKYGPFMKNIDGAKLFFIDAIIATKSGRRYCFKPIVYAVKP